MSASIEKWYMFSGGAGAGQSTAVYVPNIPEDIYIFFHWLCDQAVPTSLDVKWNGAEITGLPTYQEAEDLSLWGGTREGNTGYFKIPDADKGSEKALFFDHVPGANPNTHIGWVMVGAVGSVADVDVNNQETVQGSETTGAQALASEEMLIGFHTWYDSGLGAAPTVTVDNGVEIDSISWGAWETKTSLLWAYAKGASGSKTIATSPAVAADIYSSIWKITPDSTSPKRPFIIQGGSGNVNTYSITFNEYVDKLIAVHGDGGSASNGWTGPDYNGSNLSQIVEAGYPNDNNIACIAEAWYLDSPDTGASHTLTVDTMTTTYQGMHYFGIVNAPSGAVDYEMEEVDTGALTPDAITCDDKDLLITVCGHVGNTDVNSTVTAFRDDDDEDIAYLSHVNNGCGFHIARGEGVSLTDGSDRDAVVMDHAWVGLLIEGVILSQNRPMWWM
jgi:hypothetical protein